MLRFSGCQVRNGCQSDRSSGHGSYFKYSFLSSLSASRFASVLAWRSSHAPMPPWHSLISTDKYAKNARVEGPAAASLWFSSMILILRSCFTHLIYYIHHSPGLSADAMFWKVLCMRTLQFDAMELDTFGNGNNYSGIGSGPSQISDTVF